MSSPFFYIVLLFVVFEKELSKNGYTFDSDDELRKFIQSDRCIPDIFEIKYGEDKAITINVNEEYQYSNFVLEVIKNEGITIEK